MKWPLADIILVATIFLSFYAATKVSARKHASYLAQEVTYPPWPMWCSIGTAWIVVLTDREHRLCSQRVALMNLLQVMFAIREAEEREKQNRLEAHDSTVPPTMDARHRELDRPLQRVSEKYA